MVLEVLKLRTRGVEATAAAQKQWEAALEQAPADGLRKRRLYFSLIHPNEIMLVLNWEEPGPAAQGSELARSLAYQIKQWGLVERSLWSPRAGGSDNGA